MTDTPVRILIVEDDDAFRDALEATLLAQGYVVAALPDGVRIRDAINGFRPDLTVLDVHFRCGPSGLTIARMIREHDGLPIMFLTCADALEDRLAGFDAGGDDYLTEPFATDELLARIRALLRRSGRLASTTWQYGDLVVDEVGRRVARAGHAIELTRTEFDLLRQLGRRPHQVVSKAQLLRRVWGADLHDTYDVNLVEVHICALRRKLEARGPRLIHTIRGSGYRLGTPD